MTKHRVWQVKHGSTAAYIYVDEIPHFDEHLVISPHHVLLYNIDKDTPNPYLQPYGYVMSNIPGDAMVIQHDDKGETVDIDWLFKERLAEMLVHDNDRRLEFNKMLADLGGSVIYIGNCGK